MFYPRIPCVARVTALAYIPVPKLLKGLMQKEIEGLEQQLTQSRSKMSEYLKQLGVEVGTGGPS